MELIDVITKLISNVGFPIACVCMMFVQSEKDRDRHSAESEKWVAAIDRNSDIMQKLVSKLDK